jgi:hypothetical protein
MQAARRKALLEIDDGHARGIHFFCVNASIRSQFEFVQQTWCNNRRVGGLNDNKDSIGRAAALREGQGRRVLLHVQPVGAALSRRVC